MRLRAKYNLSLEAQVFYHYGYTVSSCQTALSHEEYYDECSFTILLSFVSSHRLDSRPLL